MKIFLIPCAIASMCLLVEICSSCTKPKQPSELPHKEGWSLFDDKVEQDAQSVQESPQPERRIISCEEVFYKEYAKNPELIGLTTIFLNPPQDDSYLELTKWATATLPDVVKGYNKLHPKSKLTDVQKVDALTREIEDFLSQSQDLSGIEVSERGYFYNDMARYRLAVNYLNIANHLPAMQTEIEAWEKFYHAFTSFNEGEFFICIGGQGSFILIATTSMTKYALEARIADMRALCQPQGRQCQSITQNMVAPLLSQIDASIEKVKEKGSSEYRSPMVTDKDVVQTCKDGEELKVVLNAWIAERGKFAATLDKSLQGFYNAQTENYIKNCCESLKRWM